MRFTIEIPDELFRSASSISLPPVNITELDAASGAMSGGAGPGTADGGAIDLGEASQGLSAGAAEQQVEPIEPGAATDAINDGGPAPVLG